MGDAFGNNARPGRYIGNNADGICSNGNNADGNGSNGDGCSNGNGSRKNFSRVQIGGKRIGSDACGGLRRFGTMDREASPRGSE